MNNTTINILLTILMDCFISQKKYLIVTIVWQYSMFNFLGNCPNAFHNSCTILHSFRNILVTGNYIIFNEVTLKYVFWVWKPKKKSRFYSEEETIYNWRYTFINWKFPITRYFILCIYDVFIKLRNAICK
jgi:hypothetical protein